ncbi:hypothetical protein DRW41_09800 [Neobacillus piezotolerans]|uniref:YhfM-like domain-containing protein n=1 Tax=Neobacillus piezotolerans TaxID=2259171 RepID=A0A3D8GRU0_9BACI|nr:hypothetical protein [Neobacillus piezotolerans]RDU36981.1 hypothetical protein DRW41_09800 [Neobacillus piezotolerans]
MAKLLKSIISIIAVLTLLSCSTNAGSGGNSVQKLHGDEKNTFTIENSMQTTKREISVRMLTGDQKITFTDEYSIKTIERAINGANRIPGIVDVVFPDFRVIAGEEIYDLWLREVSGSIMNLKDTHTVYTLTPASAKELYELLEPIIDKQ